MATGAYEVVPLPVLLRQRAASMPDRVFVEDVDGGSLTYAGTYELAQRWARRFRQLGIGAGDRVATFIPNSVESVSVWLGLALLRAIEVPVHPAFRGRMIVHAVTSVGARVVVADPAWSERIAEVQAELDGVEHTVVLGDVDLGEADGGDEVPHQWDIANIIYTSGTTGPSKGVEIRWTQLCVSAMRTFPFEDLNEDDVFYVFTPASHVGAKILPYLAALVGGRAVVRPEFKMDQFLPDVRRFGITTAPIIGAIPHFLAQSAPAPDDATIPLRNLVMAPMVPDLEGFKRRFGVRVCTAYNMTELSIPFTSNGWEIDDWTSVGRLQPGWPFYEARLVDEHDYEVPTGEVGELVLRTGEPWALTSGYFGVPAATAEAWRNGWLHTGDAFRRDDQGRFYFIDRMKDTIRRRGENVSSFEVESMVNEYPAVFESAAIAVPAETSEDEIKILIVVKPERAFDPRGLIEFLIPRMPRFMIPRYVEVVDELPKTIGTARTKKLELRARGNTEATWDRVAAGVVLPR